MCKVDLFSLSYKHQEETWLVSIFSAYNQYGTGVTTETLSMERPCFHRQMTEPGDFMTNRQGATLITNSSSTGGILGAPLRISNLPLCPASTLRSKRWRMEFQPIWVCQYQKLTLVKCKKIQKYAIIYTLKEKEQAILT